MSTPTDNRTSKAHSAPGAVLAPCLTVAVLPFSLSAQTKKPNILVIMGTISAGITDVPQLVCTAELHCKAGSFHHRPVTDSYRVNEGGHSRGRSRLERQGPKRGAGLEVKLHKIKIQRPFQ